MADIDDEAHVNERAGQSGWTTGALAGLAGVAALVLARFAVDLPSGAISLYWERFVLDLLGSSLLFVAIERFVPLRLQRVLRPGWWTDVTNLVVNHLLAGVVTILASLALRDVLGWMVSPSLQRWIGGLPFLVQVVLALVVADFLQYWIHRAFHRIPVLWRVHAVHHSIETMDWLAGFRMHLFELMLTRVVFLCALLVLGFDQAAINAYVVVVGLQTVFNHANLRLPAIFSRAPLKWLIVTPHFHHWHHTVEPDAIDHNYASHFAFLDYLFGTAVKPDRFPDSYGVVGNYVPEGYVRQQLFPLTWKG
jgi:sterol desaturase/sphingolipid hydroxylase (fatty acid hydroxylase superfamily)